jgi:putative N6-adenine-specific DNA methylase
METQKALSKRIKRHVVGRVREYFAVTAPGLEALCLKELKAPPLAFSEAEAITGGVTFNGKLADCYQANLHLRTAGRILLRLSSFRASGYRELKKHLAQTPWELYLRPGSPVTVRASATHCRVHQSADIAEHVTRSLTAVLGRTAVENPQPERQTIFIRGENDRFTLSIDSSGALLYRRGIKTHKSRAPLRETLAAAVLKLACWRPQTVLADPMCGSGSFSLEAAMQAKQMPAGWFRSFAFQSWPSFAERRWAHLKRECGRRILTLPSPLIFASDIDRGTCRALEACLNRHELADAVKTFHRDFFGINPRSAYPAPGLVVINPPYGRRLNTTANVERIYRHIGEKLGSDFRGWRAAVIISEKRLRHLLPLKGKTFRLLHGGLSLGLLVGRVGTNP